MEGASASIHLTFRSAFDFSNHEHNCQTKRFSPPTAAGELIDSDGSEHEDDELIDPKQEQAKEEAQKQRKRAGLPELELDSLPSIVATKMMKLGFIKHRVTALPIQVLPDEALQVARQGPRAVWGRRRKPNSSPGDATWHLNLKRRASQDEGQDPSDHEDVGRQLQRHRECLQSWCCGRFL